MLVLASISDHQSTTVAPRAEEHQVSQSRQTDMGKRGFVVRQ